MARPTKTTVFRTPTTLPPPTGYSQLVDLKGGKIIILSGQMSRDSSGELVGRDDFAAQVEQCFKNIELAVAAAGGAMSDVVKLNYYCHERVSPESQRSVAPIRDRFVNVATPPCSTFVVVSRLARPDWLIEIEAIAHLKLDEGEVA